MNFKKRRHQKTINKNDAKVRRGQVMDRPAMGVLYGDVQQLSVQMEFLSPEGHVVLQQNRRFGPSDIIDFEAPCPGRCGNGRTDLEGKLRSMIERKETSSQARAKCPETLLAGAQDACGTELRCQITISYKD